MLLVRHIYISAGHNFSVIKANRQDNIPCWRLRKRIAWPAGDCEATAFSIIRK